MILSNEYSFLIRKKFNEKFLKPEDLVKHDTAFIEVYFHRDKIFFIK